VVDLKFKFISIEDKELFEKFFVENNVIISEYTFTNLYVWSKSRKVQYAIYKDGLIIFAEYNNEKYFLPPVGFSNFSQIVLDLSDYGLKNNIKSIKRLNENEVILLKDLNKDIIDDRDNYDYLYNTKDIGLLQGKRYSGKRNLYLNFSNDYEFEFIKYNDNYKDQCLNISKKWIENKDSNDKTLFNEYLAINELIDNTSKLSVTGYILIMDGNVKGFIFGEKLNNDTFVVHFEKADNEYRGIYQAINKIYVEKEIMDKFEFVNREQDLGIEGIRKAKESYFPVKMIKKYTLNF